MWFWWGLSSAFFSAVSVVLSKKLLKNTSASVVSWSLFALNIPLVAGLVLIDGIEFKVNPGFYLAVLGSSLVFSLAMTMRLSAIKHGLLSKLSPLTAFNPFFVYVLGLIFLAETISLKGIAGLILITLGAYILNVKKLDGHWLRPFKLLLIKKASLLFIAGVFLTSLAAILDKTAVINTKPMNPALGLLAENLIISMILLIFLQLKKPGWQLEVKQNFKGLMVTSLIYGLSSWSVFKGFSQGPVALTVGVKQLQLFFILIFGLVMFKDKPSKYSWLAAILMSLGVLLIKLG